MTFWVEKQGEILALLAAVCWAGCVVPFARAVKLIGAFPVNLIRLVMTVFFLTVYATMTRNSPLPEEATAHNWLWLSLSGFAGFFIGDLFGFRALVLIGPRLSCLIAASLAPPVAALVAWAWMGESMTTTNILGMAAIIAGVGWVVTLGSVDKKAAKYRVTPFGLFCGFGAALSQGVGVVMSKYGMESLAKGGASADYDFLSATQIRAVAATLSLAVFMLLLKRSSGLIKAVTHSKAMIYTLLAALVGPTVGVLFMMRSIQMIPSGIVQTLVGITPILVLPLVIVFEKERVGLQALVGTVVAVVGIGLLFN